MMLVPLMGFKDIERHGSTGAGFFVAGARVGVFDASPALTFINAMKV